MAIDPNTVISMEQFVASSAAAMLGRWQSMKPGDYDESILARRDQVIELIAPFIPKARIEPFRAALAAGDGRAKAALAMVHSFLCQACGQLIARCGEQQRSGFWQDLNRDAGFAARLARACDLRSDLATAYTYLAHARRAMGDNLGTVESYSRALAAAQGLAGRGSLLGALHDNMANALRDLGFFDEALDHYELAQACDSSVGAVKAVLFNKSYCLQLLGELRSAGRTLSQQIEQLEAKGESGSELARTLDMNAQALIGLGESRPALEMLERARKLFAPGDLKDRAINALLLSKAYKDPDNPDAPEGPGDSIAAAAEAFQQAHDLAMQAARQGIDADFYRRGFEKALKKSVPPGHDAFQSYIAGVFAKEHDDPQGALRLWQQAAKLAQTARDTRLRLRVQANVVALLADIGRVDDAISNAAETCREAAEAGLALPELMVTATLASLAASGADIRDPLGPLGPLSRAVALREVHQQIVARHNLDPLDYQWETADTGSISNELALLAQKHTAYDLSARYFLRATAIARDLHLDSLLVNRLAGLRLVLEKLGRTAEAAAAAMEMSALLASGKLPLRSQIVGHRALAAEVAGGSRPAAIEHLRSAVDAAERLRAQFPPGPTRADCDTQYRDVFYRLAKLLSEEKQEEAAFDALQRAKGRRLIEALAARAADGQSHADAPLCAQEAYRLMERAGSSTALVDLVVHPEEIVAYVLAKGRLQVLRVPGEHGALEQSWQGDVDEREARAVDICLHDKTLRQLAESIFAAVPAGSSLMMVPAPLLQNLPLHAIPVQGKPWIEQMPMGYAPTAAILRFERAVEHTGALVAGDSRGDLPGAAEECRLVGTALAAKPLIGQNCTRAAIEQVLREEKPDIVHFAMHGRGDTRSGGRSSLLMADGAGNVQWIDFDSLTSFPWTARLVVFSGCSTGLIGLRHGHQLLSVANAALEAGAASVIASLWPVDDEYAKSYMAAFYQALNRARRAGPVDLRAIMNEARNAVRGPAQPAQESIRRDGRRRRLQSTSQVPPPAGDPAVDDALTWAPFCLFGAPILQSSPAA